MIGVYVLVGKHDRILYIGASHDVARRVKDHRSKPWWSEVVDVETFPHTDWEDALATERIAIRTLGPKYNVQHDDPMVRTMAGLRSEVAAMFDEVPS